MLTNRYRMIKGMLRDQLEINRVHTNINLKKEWHAFAFLIE